jgi:hypothetical protein
LAGFGLKSGDLSFEFYDPRRNDKKSRCVHEVEFLSQGLTGEDLF